MKSKSIYFRSILLIGFTICSTFLLAQINTPQASPAGSVSSTVGLTDVKIEYFRPKMKGRKIFGSGDSFLVPFDQMWRTGANSGSKITFSTDVKVAGTDVKAGTYLILTTPGATDWTFILYSDLSLGGNVSGFDEKNVVAKVMVKPLTLTTEVKTLTFEIANISEDNTKADIRLSWENTAINVPMTVNFDEVVMKEIAEKTKVNLNNYNQAASYYLEAGKDLNKALEWMNLYLADESNAKKFWAIHTKAKILAGLDKKEEAIATAQKSIELAKANKDGDYGYIKRNEELISNLQSKKSSKKK